MKTKSPFKVIYTPEGGSRREWTIDLVNPDWPITFGIEKATGWPWATFRERLGQESAIALQALLWALRKQDGEPKLALDSVRPDMDEVDYAAACPQCGEWVTTADDVEHECTPDNEPADEPATEDDQDPEA